MASYAFLESCDRTRSQILKCLSVQACKLSSTLWVNAVFASSVMFAKWMMAASLKTCSAVNSLRDLGLKAVPDCDSKTQANGDLKST
ncbi:hypothetical protein ACOMHN_020440 [Nucella lapillus]